MSSSIRTDNQGLLSALKGQRERVIHGPWIRRIRELCLSKDFTVSHIKAHMGSLGNDVADALAKAATPLPLPPPAFPKPDLQLSFEGDIVDGPHKVWSRPLIPAGMGVDI